MYVRMSIWFPEPTTQKKKKPPGVGSASSITLTVPVRVWPNGNHVAN